MAGRLPRLAAALTAVVAAAGVVLGAVTAPAETPTPTGFTEFQLRDRKHSTHELTVGPDGSVWVTQQVQGRIVRITPEGRQREFKLPRGSMPHGIEFDRAGRLWITLEARNEIARLDRRGRILRRYPIEGVVAGPHGLTIARDGKVWWTGKEGDVIGRLDPRTGRMRIFQLPHGSTPIYIKQGCGGMYFTELTGNRIGRITRGRVIEYPIPSSDNTRPIAVAPEPGRCKVWFSEEAGGHFGVLDPRTGRIREYPLPARDDQLAALAFDRSGTLWLQFRSPDAFGRVDARRRVHKRALPTRGAVMHRIISGPGGNMWFTELMTDRVGYFDPRP